MQEFKSQFVLKPKDFLAYNKFVYFKRNRRAFALNALATLFLFVLLPLLWFQTMLDSWILSAIGASFLGLVSFLLWYLLFWRGLKRGSRAQAESVSGRALRSIAITSAGFRETTDANDCFHSWSDIEAVSLTREYVFVHLNRISAFIVPRLAVDDLGIELVRNAIKPTQLIDLVA